MHWKLKIFVLALWSVVKRLQLFVFGARSGDSRTVIVVQMGKMGDMICTTPVFRALKEKGYAVAVVGNRANRELLAGHPHVDSYHVYEKNTLSLIRELQNLSPVAALLSGPSPDVLEIALLSGAPLVVAPTVTLGYCPFETRLYRLLSKLAVKVEHRMGVYAPREYLRILEPLGIIADDTTKTVVLSPRARSEARELFKRSGIPTDAFLVGIFPSTGYEIKQWPIEYFAQVARHVIERYPKAQVLLLGSASDAPRGDLLARALAGVLRVHTLIGKHSLELFTGIVAELGMYISVDTGPVYIAEALGVSTVTIVGPMDEHEQPPSGKLHKLVYWKERKAPAIHIMNNLIFDPAEVKRQTENSKPEDACAEIDALMRELEQVRP